MCLILKTILVVVITALVGLFVYKQVKALINDFKERKEKNKDDRCRDCTRDCGDSD